MTWTTLVAAVALVVDRGRVLLVRQRRPTGTRWELPGGYVEAGETLEQAAAREALEETGVAVEVGDLVCTMVWERAGELRRNVIAYFAAVPVDADVVPRPQVAEGIEDVRYFELAALDLGEVHPMERPILERWPAQGYHLHLDIANEADGTVSYDFR
jgi:8-oxo-dGTP diphosphatase